MRLQKYIANSGFTSRRKAEILIEEGRVRVNGKVITKQGVQIDSNDEVYIDNIKITFDENKVYILLNKPVGVISTASDERSRKTVLDIISGVNERIYPVGRLDKDTSGLLILTNDGELTQKLIHPSFEVEKTYYVKSKSDLNEREMDEIRKGVLIDGRKTYPAILKKIKPLNYEITIHEGRNREVRKLFDYFNHEVISLKRIAYAFLSLGNLKEGEWRNLTKKEIERLKNIEDDNNRRRSCRNDSRDFC